MRRDSTPGHVPGTKHGVDHWWRQRVTALALVPLGVWLLVSLLSLQRFDHATLMQWMEHSWNSVLLVTFILAIAYHSYLGLRVVVEDYVHSPGRRIVTLLALQFVHVLVAMTGLFAVLKVALGSTAFGDDV